MSGSNKKSKSKNKTSKTNGSTSEIKSETQPEIISPKVVETQSMLKPDVINQTQVGPVKLEPQAELKPEIKTEAINAEQPQIEPQLTAKQKKRKKKKDKQGWTCLHNTSN